MYLEPGAVGGLIDIDEERILFISQILEIELGRLGPGVLGLDLMSKPHTNFILPSEIVSQANCSHYQNSK